MKAKQVDDYHIHLHYAPCTAPEMTARAVLDRCREVGHTRVGLVSHLHPHTPVFDFDSLGQEVETARALFPGEVLVGVEAELYDHQGGCSLNEEIYPRVDYVLLATGHIHLAWADYDFSGSPEDFLAREAESLLGALERWPVHILAHPFIYSMIHRVAPHWLGRLRPDRLPLDLLEALADRLKAGRTCLEYHCRDLIIRPERLGPGFKEAYLDFLGFFRDKQVGFVAGSDAHYLDQIGRTAEAPDWVRGVLTRKHRAEE